MIHPRTAIRVYAWDMLKAAIDVGGKVYLNRPNPVLTYDCPFATIYFSTETTEVKEGDRYVPQLYERKLGLVIDVCDEQPVDPDKLQRVEDRLDLLARQVEREFSKDIFFQRRLDGYSNEITDPGLIAGLRLVSTIPDSLQLNNDRVLATQSLTFEITYTDEAFVEKKGGIFESYLMQINRVGWDGSTVDPTLIEAQGEFEE